MKASTCQSNSIYVTNLYKINSMINDSKNSKEYLKIENSLAYYLLFEHKFLYDHIIFGNFTEETDTY